MDMCHNERLTAFCCGLNGNWRDVAHLQATLKNPRRPSAMHGNHTFETSCPFACETRKHSVLVRVWRVSSAVWKLLHFATAGSIPFPEKNRRTSSKLKTCHPCSEWQTAADFCSRTSVITKQNRNRSCW